MGSIEPASWLEKLEERMNIDVDWMDSDYIKSMPIMPYDQTSNPVILGVQLNDQSSSELLSATVKELRDKGWLAVYARMASLLCRKNLDLVKGRVLVQTASSGAYSIEKTLEHARLYDQEFQRLGVPRTRYCIKIMCTGPGLNAARTLQQEGIQTLGTGVFSVEQAIACSQAGCLYISPYYNEVRTREDPSLWPNVEDPATQHPFSNRIFQILQVYKDLYNVTGREQPLVKNAAFRSIKEVIASAELGCHSATIPPKLLDELAHTKYDKAMDPGEKVRKSEHPYKDSCPAPERLQHLNITDPLAANDFYPARSDVDYLANGGSELEKALERDTVAGNRLRDAIALFAHAERASRALIEAEMQHVYLSNE